MSVALEIIKTKTCQFVWESKFQSTSERSIRKYVQNSWHSPFLNHRKKWRTRHPLDPNPIFKFTNKCLVLSIGFNLIFKTNQQTRETA